MNVKEWYGVESVLLTVGRVHLLRCNSAVNTICRVLSFLHPRLYVMHVKVGTRGDVDIKTFDCDEFMRKEGIKRFMLSKEKLEDDCV